MKIRLASMVALLLCGTAFGGSLAEEFAAPPDSARPWVYWYFMDGNMTREGMTADLEAMQKAGIGGAIFLEVNVGIPRGPVDFFSPRWQQLFTHAVSEADRLKMQIALAAGPGWCGTGGPWVKPELSMQNLVASETTASGPSHFQQVLPRPMPRTPFFGEGTLTPGLREQWKNFYQDVAVVAFSTPGGGGARLADIDEKALYKRPSFSSMPGTKAMLPSPADAASAPPDQCVPADRAVDLTANLSRDGRLRWDVPAGNWTILRFGRTTTGQTTRPAPLPGLGFETDKFDPAALDAHLATFEETLLKQIPPTRNAGCGLTMLHFDSWEMGSQNWSGHFRDEFRKRRGYDPLAFLPVLTGRIVDDAEVSERFLWDLRQTAQELVIANHTARLREFAHQHGLTLSIEPYDLDPCADLNLGSTADLPMGEFWSWGYGFKSEYSCIEAVSVGHTNGRPVIGAESFTSEGNEAWHQLPGSMKAQADWALCAGINKFVIHRYQHQPWMDRFPGMTMGPYGVHWERTQTWWDMVPAFHLYLSRCSQMLRQGLPVADILYLTPEGAPQVFVPPTSAVRGDRQDRRGYNFDGCSPDCLMSRASVKDGRIVFPDGMSYRLLVLPEMKTMTPGLLGKIKQLIESGAMVLGAPPVKSPSLADYPKGDAQVRQLAADIWGTGGPGADRAVKAGKIFFDSQSQDAAMQSTSLAQAKWIWQDEGSPAQSAPLGTRYFRRTIQINAQRSISLASFIATADNTFELKVNGHVAGQGDNFHIAYASDVTPYLRPAENQLLIAAANTGDAPNPAGFIGALIVQYSDGTREVVATDGKWSSSTSLDGQQTPAKELGPLEMAPWGAPEMARHLYPDYASTEKILAGLGVPPDFEADAEIRYTHRQLPDGELYFVANAQDASVSAVCKFRAAGRQPQWWNPVTGEMRDLPDFQQAGAITTIPLHFDPNQSGFVLFQSPVVPPAPGAVAAAFNWTEPKMIANVSGPWEVSFDPKWGGPAKVVFTDLEDWSKRSESGIRHYSGKADYHATFSVTAEALKAASRFAISLGEVRDIASVRLNGKELGVTWCAPWSMTIPDNLLRERDNQLDITVANLWINRLIGDAGLPAKARLTWTTVSPYKKDSPLQPSGLIGPVTLQLLESPR